LVEPYLSSERLVPYKQAAGGDLEAALRLYEWNARVGSAFLEVLGHVEVVLRNALDRQLAMWHAAQQLSGPWYLDPLGLLDERRRDDVAAARRRLQREAKQATRDRIVAELPFGFWRFLLGRRYQNSLWTQALRHAFPGLKTGKRADAYELVDGLSHLRNRIAHHEPVHHLPLPAMHEDLLQLAGFIDFSVRLWIVAVSRVPEVLLRRP
jgi:hypothetical protein